MLFLFDKLLQNTENSSRTTGRGLGRGGNGLDTNPARVEPLQGHPIGQERVCELRRKLQRAAGQWGRGSFPLKVMAHAYLQCDGSVQVIQRCTKIPYTTLREAKRRVDAHRKQQAGLVSRGAGALVAYKCKICASYHTGHR